MVNNWVWTELTESKYPNRKSGDSVPIGYLIKGHNEYNPYPSWIKRGYASKIIKYKGCE